MCPRMCLKQTGGSSSSCSKWCSLRIVLLWYIYFKCVSICLCNTSDPGICSGEFFANRKFWGGKKKVMNFSSMLSDHIVQMVPYTSPWWLQNTTLRSFLKPELGFSLKRMMAQKLTNLQPPKVNTDKDVLFCKVLITAWLP